MADDEAGEQTYVRDPTLYVGRVTRDASRRVRNIQVIYDDETIDVRDGDEFVTFQTQILLEEDPFK